MLETTLFDSTYESRKRPLLKQVLEAIRPIYSANELKVLRINSESRDVLSLRSGRGFVNRDILETVLGNLLECVAPGSHNAPRPENSKDELSEAIEEVADQLYAMIAQSFLAVTDESEWGKPRTGYHVCAALGVASTETACLMEPFCLSARSGGVGCLSAPHRHLP